MTASADKFWMVWNPHRREPTYRHPSKQLAQDEAKRLATCNPGEQFFVLKAIGGFECSVSEPATITLVKGAWHDDPDSHVPF